MNLIDLGEFNGRRLYTGPRLDYRLRLWTPTSASRAVSEVAELLAVNTEVLPIFLSSSLSKAIPHFPTLQHEM